MCVCCCCFFILPLLLLLFWILFLPPRFTSESIWVLIFPFVSVLLRYFCFRGGATTIFSNSMCGLCVCVFYANYNFRLVSFSYYHKFLATGALSFLCFAVFLFFSNNQWRSAFLLFFASSLCVSFRFKFKLLMH